jgi:hypothetical protein
MYPLSFQDNGCAAVATAKPASGAVSQGKLAVLHLDCRMSFAAQLPNRFNDLCHPPAIGRVIVAEPAAVSVHRQAADARDQLAVGDEAAALALLAEAQVL